VPTSDPHLPPGTPCEVFDPGIQRWLQRDYGHSSMRSLLKYIADDGTVWDKIRFRLSDIQDRGEKMVGKMVKA